MSEMFGRVICDNAGDCEDPDSPGSVCTTTHSAMEGWIVLGTYTWCDVSCKESWEMAMGLVKKEEPRPTPRVCPFDGKPWATTYIYGLPTPEMFEREERDPGIRLAGCVIHVGVSPDVVCPNRHFFRFDENGDLHLVPTPEDSWPHPETVS